jgi:hypothetical protein
MAEIHFRPQCSLTFYQTISMVPNTRDKERERFYLLPGMGGRAVKRKQKWMMQWAVVTGLFVSAVLAAAMYWVNHLWR